MDITSVEVNEIEKFYMLMMKTVFPGFPGVDYQITVLDDMKDFTGELKKEGDDFRSVYSSSDFVVKLIIDAEDMEKLNIDNRDWDKLRNEVLDNSLRKSYDLIKFFSLYKFNQTVSSTSFYRVELEIKDFYKIDESINQLSFSEALEEVKSGKRIAREGWNGNGMFVYYVGPDEYDSKTDAAKKTFGEKTPYLPYLALKTVDDKVVPWLASQTDILAEDWIVLD